MLPLSSVSVGLAKENGNVAVSLFKVRNAKHEHSFGTLDSRLALVGVDESGVYIYNEILCHFCP